ncbi:MAG TPA: NAD(P)/FAD-dependent oxidoreductase [Xanthobacteraceae bacterium]|nr:NAD(P)/FAD-dependent oxidoreductase [Xanthobacteraceae bacterium]
MRDIDVVVIGAGAAGIAAARALDRHAVVVIEARDRVGGRAWTCRKGSLALDLGCAWLHSADQNEWAALAPTLGFAVDTMLPPWERPAHPANFAPGERADYHAAWDRFYTRLEAAAAQNSTARMSALFEPDCRWNGLLGAMVTYINGVEADQLVVAEYARYRDTEINRRIAQGYGSLIEAYAKPLDVRLVCPATLIDHSGARVRVTTAQGALSARAAIIAVPPGVIANGTLRFAPALPDKLAAAQALPLGVADKVFLSLDGADDLPLETRLYGATDRVETGSYTLRPFGRPIIDGYFGGKFARAITSEGEGALTAFAIEQICGALGHDFRKRLHPIVETAWAHDPWALGAYSYGGAGAAAARATLAAPVDGKLFFAGEHCSDVDFSTAHGAYRSGVKAATEVMGVFGKGVGAGVLRR